MLEKFKINAVAVVKTQNSPVLYDYNNYRAFLRDYYEVQKQKKTGFTYSKFAKSSGLGSPNYYKLVMEDEKNLTANNIIRFSKGLNFSEDESEFFEALVNFNQAKDNLEREYYYERVIRIRKRKNSAGVTRRTLEEYEFECISNWLHHTIMVLTNIKGFKESPHWIKSQLYNLTSEQEIIEILEVLKTLKLLNRDSEGQLKQTHKRVKTKPDLKRASIKIFYNSLLQRAQQSLETQKPDHREMNTYLVGLSKEQLPELKNKVRKFMSSLNEWAMENQEPEQVYALLFAGFPLTQGVEKQWS